MLAPGGEMEEPTDLAALALKSRRLYPGFVRELESVSERTIDFQEHGALDLAYSTAEHEKLESRANAQTAFGVVSKPVTAGQVVSFWPHIRINGLAGARFYPDDAIVDPRDVIASLLIACERSGVKLLPQCSVLHAAISATHVLVRTEHWPGNFDVFVIAAGAWSSCISVHGVPALPACEPVRGHLIGYQQPAQTCHTIIRHGHSYLLQRANGLLIAGATSERVGFAREIDSRASEVLAAAASFVFPHLSETTPTEAWIGFRPVSERLQLGEWHSRRLLLAYGHYRNGILLAPASAQQIAETVTSSSQKR